MLNPFAEIRTSERRAAYSAFFTLFGIMIGHALLETARDALFLASLPPTRLPYVYLAVAVVAAVIFSIQQRNRHASSGDVRQLTYWLLGSAGITLLFWALARSASSWVYYALYIWLGVFTTLVLVRFWILVGDLFTVTQAKRLFAPIGVGGVLGAIVGSALARMLAGMLPPTTLLLAASGAIAASAAGPYFWWPGSDPESAAGASPQREMMLPFRTILERPYLRRVAEILFLGTVTLTLVDFLFKYVVAYSVAPERLASFFAGTYLVFNLLSLLTQLVLVGWFVRTLGVNRVLSVLPALLFIGGAGVLILGGLVPVLLLKAIDGTFRHSLHRTSTEVLYVPLTAELRARAKGFMDVFTQRGGQAITSLLILLLTFRGPTVLLLSLSIVILSILWVLAARRLRTHYLDLFRETLNEVSVQTRFDFPELDLASLETLIAALNSPNDAEVVATLDMLAEQDRVRLIPALILYHPSSLVVIRALELFTTSGRDDFLPITHRLLEHRDPEVRAAVLRARSWTSPDPGLFEEFATDPSPIVRATSLIGMISYGSSRAASAKEAIDNMAESGLKEEKLSLARAIRYSPGAGYEDTLLKIADTPNSRVRLAVVAAMHEIQSYRFIPKLLEFLPSRSLRAQVRHTLVAMGNPVLEELDAALGDSSLDPSIRRQIPRCISEFNPEKAGEVLMRHLAQESDGAVRYRILRALGRVKAAEPALELDREQLERAVGKTLNAIYRVMDWRDVLETSARRDPTRKTPVQELMRTLLEHKEYLATERLFRLLGLLYPDDDLRSLYRGIRSSNPQVRSSSQELLESILVSPVKEAVLSLADEVPVAEKLRYAEPFHVRTPADYDALLRTLLEHGSVGMRCLVAYHVGELHLGSLRDALEVVPEDDNGLIRRAVDRAVARLEPSP